MSPMSSSDQILSLAVWEKEVFEAPSLVSVSYEAATVKECFISAPIAEAYDN